MDKNNSNPWGQNDDLVAQQLAWGSTPGPLDPAPLAQSSGHRVPTDREVRGEIPPSPKSGREADIELHAIIGAGTSFHGTLSFSGHVRIDGEFAGQVLGGRILVIGDGARVQGEIRARRVVILGGNVKADIFASEGIELYVPAQVAGDLQAPEIHMDRGVKFQGTCDLSDPTEFRGG